MPPSEFDLIARHFARPTPQAILGPGDDCALIAPSPGMELAITTDMLVSGTHFLPDTDPGQLGWKTLAVNLSDLAAMGARPRWALLAGSLPDANETWLAAFADGLFACAKRFGVDLIGGDTTRGPLNLCMTALGEVPAGEALRRDGALAGDDLWVSGQPGLAALGLAHLQGRTFLPEALAARCRSALQRPWPRVDLGMALLTQRLAHAAIDVSDGLLADLGHIAKRSRLDAEVFLPQLPGLPAGAEPLLARSCQLAGGDDYELVFAAAPGQRHELAELASRLDLPLWRIGRMIEATDESPGEAAGPGRCPSAGNVIMLDENGQPVPATEKGYDHFAQDTP
ncbi:thiamine-phosphate kinase [Propionivibrio sp.]|uniref:thiamine-phosphate kinase n=1 Tax=Propionivibrio sp. TaxID=2212460 RepID=UPI0025E13409|nr:thiamine-phosphate kinase [Propionivibrio sp.]MBK8400700.1 thiamine-phosphate kinase [Propionivibrio sp.]MBK8744731.1 thiamine-phosphate kinase [Propionivibrio sp.]